MLEISAHCGIHNKNSVSTTNSVGTSISILPTYTCIYYPTLFFIVYFVQLHISASYVKVAWFIDPAEGLVLVEGAQLEP